MKYQKVAINGIRLIFVIWSILEVVRLHGTNVAVLLAGLVLSFIPEIYARWTNIHIPLGACLVYNLFLFASQFLGSYLGAYGYFSWWDVMLHLVSGVMVGYAGLVILVTIDREQTLFVREKAILLSLFVFTIATTGAVFWEIIEFSGDTFLGTNAQLGSLQDTMEDLICGTIIGGGFAIYVGVSQHKNMKSCVQQLLQANRQGAKYKK